MVELPIFPSIVMDRYPKYLIRFLVLLYMLVTAHLVCCAHTHPEESHSQHCSGEHPVMCCCQNGHDAHACNEAEQPMIRVQRDVDEAVKLFPISLLAFVSDVPVTHSLHSTGICDAATISLAAPSVRLHLLYRSLLI